MAGHMAGDLVAARRGALVDVLADGRPHTREDIWARVVAEVGESCWGKRPNEALLRDLNALRRGGIQIAYSRAPGLRGYYLAYPPFHAPAGSGRQSLDPEWIVRLRGLGFAEKNAIAFAAAESALQQKRLLIAAEHADWTAGMVDAEARRLVFGARP